ncbi:MAG: hypothetical protein IPM16_06870 [Chloroflexi bacterium]|nr:hypothetical protein [Chloroflexota bacterium]
MPELHVASDIVDAFTDLIAGDCQWWLVAGSIRRSKPVVKDAEIVIIPTAGLYQRLDRMVLDGEIEKALYGDRRTTRWGDKYRGLLFQGLRIELFMADWVNVGFQTWLRTGPGDANQYVMGRMQRSSIRAIGGYLWHADRWVRTVNAFGDPDGWDSPGKRKLAVRAETFMFDLLGVDPIAPKDRSVAAYTRQKLFARDVAYDFAPLDEQAMEQPRLL